MPTAKVAVANTVENTMENERFELKTVAHTVEMAVSSSKMLQIAWKMVRTGNPKKIPKLKKKISKQFPTHCKVGLSASAIEEFNPSHEQCRQYDEDCGGVGV